MSRAPRAVPVLVAGVALVLTAGLGRASPVSAADYVPPVEAPVVDPFRAPAHPYGPGNRGIEFRTRPGTLVRAAADGVVAFAGRVAGTLHVTVAHADGIRTSYSFLRTLRVIEGQRVLQRGPVGVAGSRLHVGARRGTTYIDPAGLWAAGPPRVHLVPLDGAGPRGPITAPALAGSRVGSATIVSRSSRRWAGPTLSRAHLRSPTQRAVRGPGSVEPKERSPGWPRSSP